MPSVSIIVPVYNTEKYFKFCLDSVLAQTFSDFELILVDDGSTDNSSKICDEYANKDSRIRVFHTKNQGSAMARNVGLDNARCKMISMIDSDDYVPPSYLSTLVEIMNETGADIVGHMFKAFYSDEEVKNLDIPPYSKDSISTFNKYEALEELVLRYTTSLNSPCKLYRKKVFNNFRYPNVKKNDDEWAIHHLINNSTKIAILKERIYYYRPLAGSQTRTFSKDNYSGILAQLDRAELIENNGYTGLSVDANRNYFLGTIWFYYECLKNGINPNSIIFRNRRELRVSYKKCKFRELDNVYSRREIFALYLFSKSITAFALFTELTHVKIV